MQHVLTVPGFWLCVLAGARLPASSRSLRLAPQLAFTAEPLGYLLGSAHSNPTTRAKTGCTAQAFATHWKKGKDPHPQDKTQHLDFTKDPRPLYYNTPHCTFYHKNLRSRPFSVFSKDEAALVKRVVFIVRLKSWRWGFFSSCQTQGCTRRVLRSPVSRYWVCLYLLHLCFSDIVGCHAVPLPKPSLSHRCVSDDFSIQGGIPVGVSPQAKWLPK